MNRNVLKTEIDYNAATTRLMEIFAAQPGTPAGGEMRKLTVLVKDYDDKHYLIPALHPMESRESD